MFNLWKRNWHSWCFSTQVFCVIFYTHIDNNNNIYLGIKNNNYDRFSSNVEFKRLWVQFVQNNGAQDIYNSSMLCSRHFVADRDFRRTVLIRRLIVTAVPSIVSLV